MRAIATCKKCGKKLVSDCRPCIENKEDVHKCKGMKGMDVIEGIDWKIIEE